MIARLLPAVFLLGLIACRQSPPAGLTATTTETQAHLSPEERFGELFIAAQLGDVFPDSKTFVDCTPKTTTAEVMQRFESEKVLPDFDIARFVKANFDLPIQHSSGFQSDTSRSVREHINSLWPVLTRQADTSTRSTLLSLPEPYIVPGGRFGEIYYWDSYFTILGLQAAGKREMIERMADNFSTLIDRVGYIPNGNRTYFLGRSQPPFYALIVRLLAEEKGPETLNKYLPFLEKEYGFWMEGLSSLSPSQPTHRRLVRLEDGSILNRYWDDRPVPRPESYREDVSLAKDVERPAQELYRDIRAACESGWDFSSRWFKDGQYLSSIHTTDLIPVDLNALLYHLEQLLAEAHAVAEQEEEASLYRQRAAQRQAALLRYCWDEAAQFFVDYDFVERRSSPRLSLAGLFPLYFEMCSPERGQAVAQRVEQDFLQPGGVVTTLAGTGQQWDSPNGWAPLQWMTIEGLRRYEANALADTIKTRWVALNTRVYRETGKMVEKYNVMDVGLEAGGGEYPVQDGFGWTNGVLLRLLSEDTPK
ncbi:MAG: alpha,alpha-trehalase TreF [Bacteroidota bacterium]